jgi:hypothetical protein
VTLGSFDVRLLRAPDANVRCGLAFRALGFHYRVRPQRLASLSRRLESRSATWAPPMGFFSLRRHQPGLASWRFASPPPSALSVSHALSGFFPPGPRSLVSCCSRPWDFGLQRVPRQPSRSASRRPLPPCRCSRGYPRSPDFEALLRAGVRSRGWLLRSPSGRYAPDLSPLRGLQAVASGRSPPPLALTLAGTTDPKTGVSRRSRRLREPTLSGRLRQPGTNS